MILATYGSSDGNVMPISLENKPSFDHSTDLRFGCTIKSFGRIILDRIGCSVLSLGPRVFVSVSWEHSRLEMQFVVHEYFLPYVTNHSFRRAMIEMCSGYWGVGYFVVADCKKRECFHIQRGAVRSCSRRSCLHLRVCMSCFVFQKTLFTF